MAIHKDLEAAVARSANIDPDHPIGWGPDEGSTCATCLHRVEAGGPMSAHGCTDYEGLWVRWDGSYYVGYCQLCEATMPRKTPLNSVSSVVVWHDCHECKSKKTTEVVFPLYAMAEGYTGFPTMRGWTSDAKEAVEFLHDAHIDNNNFIVVLTADGKSCVRTDTRHILQIAEAAAKLADK